MFGHLIMMYSVVIVWPMGLYWYCVPFLVSRVMTV